MRDTNTNNVIVAASEGEQVLFLIFIFCNNRIRGEPTEAKTIAKSINIKTL